MDSGDQLDIESVWETYPEDISIVNGRPTDMPADVHRAYWGHYIIQIGDTDCTFVRNVPVILESYSHAEPYGWRDATLRFDMLTDYDPVGDDTGFGAPDDCPWLFDFNYVIIREVIPGDIEPPKPMWAGYFGSWDRTDGIIRANCIGWFHQLDLYVRAPGASDAPLNIAAQVLANFDRDAGRPALRWRRPPDAVTPWTTVDRGSWDQGVLNYIDRLIARTVQDDMNQWTVVPDWNHDDFPGLPAQPVFMVKDIITENWHITTGGRGVKLALQREPNIMPNVWYAEGEDEAGIRWRNMYPSDDSSTVFFQPLVYDADVHSYDEGEDGNLINTPARLIDGRIRVEGYVNFGQGISKPEALGILLREYNRMRNPLPGQPGQPDHEVGWTGTITLDIDTEDGNRRAIWAGQNIILRQFQGTGYAGMKFHISAAVINNPMSVDCTVELTVDSKARDANYVQDIIDRKADRVKNPVKRLQIGKESTLNKDSTVQWDSANGSGAIPRDHAFNDLAVVTIPRGQWYTYKFLAAEECDIIKTEFHLATAEKFHLSINAFKPAGIPDANAITYSGPLDDYPSDPFADGAWNFTPPENQLVGWGSFQQGAGFSPGLESRGDAATGDLYDYGVWHCSHSEVDKSVRQPAYLWAVIFVPGSGDAHGWGRIYKGVTD